MTAPDRPGARAAWGPWVLPAVALVVALAQLNATRSTTLTRWRGGGFGMYSELHPSRRQLWVVEQGSPRALDLQALEPGCRLRARSCLRWPERGCLCDVAACADLVSGQQLVAYEPVFDASMGALKRRALERCEVAP